MNNGMRLIVSMALPLALAAGCAADAKPKAAPAAATTPAVPYEVQLAAAKPVSNSPKPKGFKRPRAKGAYDVVPLLYPKREYFGASLQGSGSPVAQKNAYARTVGVQPNILKRFIEWGTPLDKAWATSLWKAGAIPQIELESWPYAGGLTLKQVAAGKGDAYVRQLAKDIRAINVPVVISFAHEFNADWYPWGFCSRPKKKPVADVCKTRPKQWPSDFVKAWKRMHGLFGSAGATNAIWLWQANQISARPENRLKYWYPGNSYVDWVGIVGYYYASNKVNHTFAKLFVPTINEVHTFSKKPILIPEVGSQPSARQKYDVRDFLRGVAGRKDVIGFMWFNIPKPNEHVDWRITARADSLKAFRYWSRKLPFGFKVHR